MRKTLVTLATAVFLTFPVVSNPTTASAQPPQLYSQDGKYLGNLSSNPYDANSTSNPYGQYGSRYSPDSINNPYGQYGSPYSDKSANNPYASQPPVVYGRKP